MGSWIMTTANERIERDIGRMVIRIDTLMAELEEAHAENDRLKGQLKELTTGVHTNGS